MHGAFAGYTGFTPGLLNTCARHLFAQLSASVSHLNKQEPDTSFMVPDIAAHPYRHYVFLPIPVIIQVCVPPFTVSLDTCQAPGAILQSFGSLRWCTEGQACCMGLSSAMKPADHGSSAKEGSRSERF